jgi:hypothetical protein
MLSKLKKFLGLAEKIGEEYAPALEAHLPGIIAAIETQNVAAALSAFESLEQAILAVRAAQPATPAAA